VVGGGCDALANVYVGAVANETEGEDGEDYFQDDFGVHAVVGGEDAIEEADP